MWFGKKKNGGPDAGAQMKRLAPKDEAIINALEDQRDYMERMLTLWIQGSERYTAMPNFIPRINAFLRRVSGARSMEELVTINTEFSAFAEEAAKFESK